MAPGCYYIRQAAASCNGARGEDCSVRHHFLFVLFYFVHFCARLYVDQRSMQTHFVLAEKRQNVQYELVEGSGGYPKNAGAMSSVATIATRYPTHHAPTQRGSFCCNVILNTHTTQPYNRYEVDAIANNLIVNTIHFVTRL